MPIPTPIDQSGVFIPPGRITRLLMYRVALYSPASLAQVNATDIEAADEGFEAGPRYIRVAAYYEPTPEYAQPGPAGITKEDSVQVSDRWWFLAEQEINDGWLIVMTACQSPNSLIGRAWVAQGNSVSNVALPGRPADSQWVYGELSQTVIVPIPY